MNVAAHGRVMLFHGRRVKRLGILLHPFLKLGIGRLVLIYILFHRFLIEAEVGTGHGIEPAADARITGGQFALRLEGNLEPETRKMKNAEWTGGAGADHWNVSVAHGGILSLLGPSPATGAGAGD